jgi:hypothetical protein
MVTDEELLRQVEEPWQLNCDVVGRMVRSEHAHV